MDPKELQGVLRDLKEFYESFRWVWWTLMIFLGKKRFLRDLKGSYGTSRGPTGPQGVLQNLKGSYRTSRGLKGHQGNLRDLKLESSSGSEGHQGVLWVPKRFSRILNEISVRASSNPEGSQGVLRDSIWVSRDLNGSLVTTRSNEEPWEVLMGFWGPQEFHKRP